MAKIIKFYFGTDSYGRSVEVVKSVSNMWYSRCKEYNGYQMSFTKWSQYEPTFEKSYNNRYSGKRGHYDTPVLMWGFNMLTEVTENLPRYRVPM